MNDNNRKLSASTEEDTNPNGTDIDEAVDPPMSVPGLPEAQGDDVPEWAIVPPSLRIPKGKSVVFLMFKASMTDAPLKGDRQCMVWTLSDGEEKLAADRCANSQNRAPAEYTKQMIRAVDGVAADWGKTRGPGSIDEFWKEIGPKGRNMMMRVYTQLHLANDEEVRDFFEHCIAVRTAS